MVKPYPDRPSRSLA